MTSLELARRMAQLGQKKDAVAAYDLALRETSEPVELLEAAVYILENGGDYKVSYTVFVQLFNRGFFQQEILKILDAVFYLPNVKRLQKRYERNCRALAKYKYIFRKDFLPFEKLPVAFFPYDDHHGYIPFDTRQMKFLDFVNVKNTVVSRNFFHDLEKPILAADVYSQYELEYLNDNVRPSEYVARENHIYLHYTSWPDFCAWLQVLDLRPLLESKKIVFLIEGEISQYPIDFKERFGIDYSQFRLRPVGIAEVSRLIWHVQLATHNGGDFFNEIFDFHPNLIYMSSIMLDSVQNIIKSIRQALAESPTLEIAQHRLASWENERLVEELFRMRSPSDKDILVAMYLAEKEWQQGRDPESRIAPALFFQPHFPNIYYKLRVDKKGRTTLDCAEAEQFQRSAMVQGFKYIKTFVPMRRA